MRKNISIWMLGIAAVLASCGQNDDFAQVMNQDGMQTVTLTAKMSDMTTRAVSSTEDDDINQCRLELWQDDKRIGNSIEGIVSDDKKTCTFTFSAKQGAYDVLLWASDASYNVGDLENVSVAEGQKPGIAYFEKIHVNEISENMTATLTHAVAKITLKTTTALPANAAVTVSAPNYSWFNVNKEDIMGSSEKMDFPTTTTTALTAGGGEIFSFYLLAPVAQSDVETVSITYEGETRIVSNVPIRANYHTILSGNLTNMEDGTLTATLSSDWADAGTTEYPQDAPTIDVTTHTFTTKVAGQLAAYPELLEQTIDLANATDNQCSLKVVGPINEADIKAINEWMMAQIDKVGYSGQVTTRLALDLSETKDITTIPQYAFYYRRVSYEDGSEWITSSWQRVLSSLTLPEGITKIEYYAFSMCANLTTVKMPSSLTEIGEGVFTNCSSLVSIDLSTCKVVPTIGKDCFLYAASPDKITVYVNKDMESSFKADGSPWKSFNIEVTQ